MAKGKKRSIRIPSSKKQKRRILTRMPYEEVLALARSPEGRMEDELADNFLVRIALRREANRMIKNGYATYTPLDDSKTGVIDPIVGYIIKDIESGEWDNVSREEYAELQMEIFGKAKELYKRMGGLGKIGYIVQSSEVEGEDDQETQQLAVRDRMREQFYPNL